MSLCSRQPIRKGVNSSLSIIRHIQFSNFLLKAQKKRCVVTKNKPHYFRFLFRRKFPLTNLSHLLILPYFLQINNFNPNRVKRILNANIPFSFDDWRHQAWHFLLCAYQHRFKRSNQFLWINQAFSWWVRYFYGSFKKLVE